MMLADSSRRSYQRKGSRWTNLRVERIDAMNTAFLEVTYRQGKPIAAYYYLPRPEGQRSARTRRVDPGLLIDFAKDGRPIGIEITAPSVLSVAMFNRVLRDLGFPPVKRQEIAPLIAA
jgi:uncharacterized protein YuzE